VARWSNTFRRRWGVGVLGLTVAAVAAGFGSAQASTGSGGGGSTGQLLVCESGAVTQGDVHTSSAVATRVPEGTVAPPGCRLA
jgi:hypothetical protein